jgi:PAS domain S-box-containing protein
VIAAVDDSAVSSTSCYDDLMAIDNSGRRGMEALPAASEFFDKSLDHLCIVGFDGRFVHVNPAWTNTLGWTSDELQSTPSIALVHPDDRASTLAGRARLHSGDVLGALRNRYLCKDGTYRWFEWRSVAESERNLVYAAARDITDQVVAEERLREANAQQEKLKAQLLIADRMASLGILAAGSAHEINNPLVSVTTNLLMMLEELGTLGAIVPADRLAELTRMASEARAGAEKIGNIVRGLKTFSRVSEERLTVVEVTQVIDVAITLARNEIEHRAHLVLDYGTTPKILADDARLGQVLLNLLVNAVQAIPEGASATNEIRIVTSTDGEGRAIIEVRDTGTGIPPDIVERIFDPFFTTKPIGIGTGLGLSICHNIITGIGGRISVASERERGTTFRIELPAAAMRAEISRPAAVETPANARGSVLVVDDDPTIATVLRRVLKDHDVTITSGAKQALAVLETGERFDVILSDLMMPEMSGMELHAEITSCFPEEAERMVFMSGGVFTAGANSFLDAVPNLRLEKPFDPRTLRAIVQRFIKCGSRGDAAHSSSSDQARPNR